MYLSQSGRSRFLAASCAFSAAALLLSGGIPAHAQAADPAQTADTVDYLYVSPQGSDACSGQLPIAGGDSGPFQTLAHAQETLSALASPGLSRPVEITVDPAVCPAQDFLGRWFSAAPDAPVIWHADSARTVLIYTPAMSQQIDALAAEDFAHAAQAPVTRFYVSPSGSDAWRGAVPAEEAGNGPFRTLDRAQEAVAAFLAERPGAPVEVVFEAGSFVKAAQTKALASMKVKALSAMTAKAVGATQAAIAASHVASGTAPAIVFGKGGPIVIKGSPVTKVGVGPKMVFAHYMVCNRDYGGSVAGYERDIQEAQAAGINGFALNCGSWNGGNYKGDAGSMFQAAKAVSPDGSFKLFFSADMTGLSYAEVVQMMTAYASHPNYWRIAQTTAAGIVNRPVLSTWGGEGGTWDGPTTASVKTRWQSLVLDPLKAAGINTYFMPFFFMSSSNGQGADTNSGTIAAETTGLLSGLADGFFYAPSIMCPIDPTQANVFAGAEAYAAKLKSAGLGTMSSVTPQYWGSKQTYLGRRYIEYFGGEGLAAQWASIINVQKPDWVECFTWNDFDEASYFSPIDDVNKYWPYTAHPALGFYKSHAGALKLNQYFLNWYKTGVKPAVTSDSIYCFYRTHPKAANATNDSYGPIYWFIGDCEDDIYITTILTAPATLVVTTGSQTLSYPVAAGLVNTRVPFQVGAQSFQIVRGGQTVISQIGEPIIAVPTELNFNYYTVAASSK